jgi:pimeloyl-ACP methyl ester carboxylesterase
MQSTLHSILVRGRHMAYETAGTGKDVVLFVHGSGFTGAMWMPFARSLEPRMRAVMVDLLGHGRSEPVGPDAIVDAETDVAMLEEVARREGAWAGGRVHVVGHAYGAYLAARVGLAQPSLLRSLTLIEPDLFAPLLAERPADCVKELDHLYADGRFLDASTGGDEAWTKRFYEYWTGPGAWALLTPRQRELQLEVARKSFCEVRECSLDPRPFSAYAALPKSLLLVTGARSTKCAQRIVARLGQVTGHVVHIVPSATHFLPITHGPELMELALRLWAIPESSVSLAHVGAM